jgi:hypothetical protein
MPKITMVRMSPALHAGLERVKRREGIPHSEQIRRAIRLWLDRCAGWLEGADAWDAEALPRTSSRVRPAAPKPRSTRPRATRKRA